MAWDLAVAMGRADEDGSAGSGQLIQRFACVNRDGLRHGLCA